MKTYHDRPYLALLRDVMKNGRKCVDRTGTGTIKVFSRQMRFDLSDGTIPLLTTKRMYLPAIFHELLWYLKGETNIDYLKKHGVRIWDSWVDENGNLGRGIYGNSWRRWPNFQWDKQSNVYVDNPIDQIALVIEKLKTNPDDRRLLVTAWNPSTVPEDGKTFSENVMNGKQALPACHYAYQFFSTEMTQEERIRWFTFIYGENDIEKHSNDYIESVLFNHNIPTRSLSCMLNQRSCDLFLGVGFNIAQYSILTRMICEIVDMAPGEFIWNGGDTHIYLNHFEQVKEQLKRDPYPSPTLRFKRVVDNIDDFGYDDFVVENYQFYPTIKAEVSV